MSAYVAASDPSALVAELVAAADAELWAALRAVRAELQRRELMPPGASVETALAYALTWTPELSEELRERVARLRGLRIARARREGTGAWWCDLEELRLVADLAPRRGGRWVGRLFVHGQAELPSESGVPEHGEAAVSVPLERAPAERWVVAALRLRGFLVDG